MSSVTRKGIQLLVNTLGDAWVHLTDRLGNLNTKPGGLLKLEATLCRLRGSTLFHDADYTYLPSIYENWSAIGGSDRVGLGLQGAIMTTPIGSALNFRLANTLSQANPNACPPCPEGWGIENYHAWSNWKVAKKSDETLSQYNTRLIQKNPVRFVGADTNPIIVPMFERARCIAIQRPSGVSRTRIKITLTKSQIEGVHYWSAATETPSDTFNASNGPTPIDIRFYYYGNYTLNYNNTSGAWTVIGSAPSTGDVGVQLNHLVFASSALEDAWDFYIDIPTTIDNIWSTLDWWPIIMYVGTNDDTHSLLTMTPSNAYAVEASAIKVFEWKNFFRNELVDRASLLYVGIHDGKYLVSQDKTHFVFYDGQFSDPPTPPKYLINSNWPEAPYLGAEGSLTGWIRDIKPGCAVCVVLTTRNQGTTLPYFGYSSSTDAVAIQNVLVGPQITPEFLPTDWSSCPYFPPVPDDQNIIAKLVLVRAPGSTYGLVESVQSSRSSHDIYPINGGDREGNSWNIYDNISIAWMEQAVPTHAQPFLADEGLAMRMLTPLRNVLQKYRNIFSENAVLDAGFNTIVPASRVGFSLAKNRSVLSNPNNLASRTMRIQLKQPIDPLLKTYPNTPIQFSRNGNTLINELCGAPVSTDLLKLDSDYFHMTNNQTDQEAELEIYLSPSDHCGVADTSSAGNRTALDYTLRLELLTGTENTLWKDWYINASKYFLSNGEYDKMASQGNPMIGYFKYGSSEEIASLSPGVLQTMNQFRLYGYAGVVPDLMQGKSVKLQTREVAPPDSTQITEAQFIQDLKNKGYNQAQIDEAVSDFLDNGGVFYVVNQNHYSNKFKAIKSASICVANFSLSSTYWVEDYKANDFFLKSVNLDDTPPPPPPVNMARADAFTIASSGLQDGSTLEAWGSQASAISSDVDINQTNYTGTDKLFNQKKIAFALNPTADCSVTEFELKLKAITSPDNTTQGLLNSTGSILISLYSDSLNTSTPGPSIKIATAQPINYSILTNKYQAVTSTFSYNFVGGVKYWLVLELSEEPKGGMIAIDTRTPVNVFTKLKDYNDNWTNDSLSCWLLTYDSSNVAHPATNNNTGDFVFLSYPQIGCQFTASSSFNLESIEMKFKSILFSSNKNTRLLNADTEGLDVALYTDSGNAPSSLVQKGSRILYKNITTDSIVLKSTLRTPLVSGTKYWVVLTKSEDEKGGKIAMEGKSPYHATAYSSVDGVSFSPDYGQEYIEFHSQPTELIAVFNRRTSNINAFLPGPNTTRAVNSIYMLDGYWSYSIKKFKTPTALAVYPRSIKNPDTNLWEYVRFANNVYGIARLLKNNKIIDVYFHFNRANADSDPAPSPIVLSDDNGPILADGLVYLGVAKTNEELLTPTHGAPPGDILILRSV